MAKEITINKEKGIRICADLLAKGHSRKEIVQTITKDYKVSAPCIDKWIKAARPMAESLQQEAEVIRVRETTTAISDAVKEGLLNDTEIEMVLCKIVSGGFSVEEIVKGQIILRDVTPFEQINAARTIYQKRGSNAAPKLPKGKDGKDFEPMAITLNLG